MPQAAPPPHADFLIGDTRYTGAFAENQETQWASGEVSEPDVDWSFVDNCGHFHAFDTYSSELPTLNRRTEHAACNGKCGSDDCDGYTAVRFYCRICDEPIEPKFNTVTKTEIVATLCSWSATVRGPFIAPGTQVSVLIEREGWPTRFGVAIVGGVTYESGGTAEIELIGDGRLGHRPLAEVTIG